MMRTPHDHHAATVPPGDLIEVQCGSGPLCGHAGGGQRAQGRVARQGDLCHAARLPGEARPGRVADDSAALPAGALPAGMPPAERACGQAQGMPMLAAAELFVVKCGAAAAAL